MRPGLTHWIRARSMLSSSDDEEAIRPTRPPAYRTNVGQAPAYTGRQGSNMMYRAASSLGFVESWREGVASTASMNSSLHPNGRPRTVEEERAADAISAGATSLETMSPAELRYVYYRVYMEDEAIISKKPVYSDDRTLGRILATSVPPPHTVESFKRCITKAEGILSFSKCDLYLDLTSGSPVEPGPLSLLAQDSPGSTPERFMALVYTSSTRSEAIKRETIKREVEIPAADAPLPLPPLFRLRFNKKITATQDCDHASVNPKFLNVKKGEVLDTDGKSRLETFTGRSGGRSAAHKFKVYEAINSVGGRGFVMKNTVKFC